MSESEVVTVVLVAQQEQARQWYQDLNADPRFRVLSYVTTGDEIPPRVASLRPRLLVLDAALLDSPPALIAVLERIHVDAVCVLLPPETSERARAEIAAARAVALVWQGDVAMGDVADEMYAAVAEQMQRPVPSTPSPVAPPTAAAQPSVTAVPVAPTVPVPSPEEMKPRRIVAFWSGTAGGTGRTTLALGLALLAAEWGANAALLALAEPALSAYLSLPRTPNVSEFDPAVGVAALAHVLTWQKQGGAASLPLLLGPARPRDGKRLQPNRILAAIAETYDLLLLDLPALVCGSNSWSLDALAQADEVVLVPPLSAAGVVSTIEALATLRDLKAGARVHLAVNHRAPGGMPAAQLVEGVQSVWGDCPALVAETPFAPELPNLLDRGELLNAEAFLAALEPLAVTVAGLRRPVPPVAETAPVPATPARRSRPVIRVDGDGQPRLRIRLT